MKTTTSYEENIIRYVDALTNLIKEHYTTNLSNLTPPTVKLIRGVNYDKIVKIDNQTSVHTFVDRSTGDILKAASFKAPAKHPRGNIYYSDVLIGVNVYGAEYIR